MLPTLETERLILRPINKNDALDMFEYAHTDLVGPSAGWHPHLSIDETRIVIGLMMDSMKRTGLGTMAIVYKANKKMIGTIELFNCIQNFKADLGYSINSSYWGMGITVEAAKKVFEWAFNTLKLVRIQVQLFTDNHQSERVCQKLHMEYEGIARSSYLRYDGKIFDCKIYSMTSNRYKKIKDEYYE